MSVSQKQKNKSTKQKNKLTNMEAYNKYRVALAEFIANPSPKTLAALHKIKYVQTTCCPQKAYDSGVDLAANCDKCPIRQPIDNLETICLLCYMDDPKASNGKDPVVAALVAALMLQPIFEGGDAKPRDKEA